MCTVYSFHISSNGWTLQYTNEKIKRTQYTELSKFTERSIFPLLSPCDMHFTFFGQLSCDKAAAFTSVQFTVYSTHTSQIIGLFTFLKAHPNGTNSSCWWSSIVFRISVFFPATYVHFLLIMSALRLLLVTWYWSWVFCCIYFHVLPNKVYSEVWYICDKKGGVFGVHLKHSVTVKKLTGRYYVVQDKYQLESFYTSYLSKSVAFGFIPVCTWSNKSLVWKNSWNGTLTAGSFFSLRQYSQINCNRIRKLTRRRLTIYSVFFLAVSPIGFQIRHTMLLAKCHLYSMWVLQNVWTFLYIGVQ